MSTLHVNLIGRFGNQMFQYAYARAYAERHGDRLTTNRWVGEQIFDLPDHIGEDGVTCPEGYHQDQASLIYTRKHVKEWFRFKPEIEKILDGMWRLNFVAHQRIGDYKDLGYVVVSKSSYFNAFKEYGYNGYSLSFCSEELPAFVTGLPPELFFVADFYLMMEAKVLLRANSTFSWWAATLGNAKVYSPVIEGLEGGKEQDCKFVEGNWPRFANLPFVTDLHLEEG